MLISSCPYYYNGYWRVDYVYTDVLGNEMRIPRAMNESLNSLLASITFWTEV